MSDNKKYYYLKFKENYFEQDHIKVIEAMKNGYEYSLIILKLYLKSLKFDGQLRINERIPYNASKIDLLAGVIGHDPANVMHAINIAKEVGIIEILTGGEMFMSDIQNFIGHDSSEAERKRLYRAKIKAIEDKSYSRDVVPKTSDERPPELEIESEIESEKKKKGCRKPNRFFPPTQKEVQDYLDEKGITSFDGQYFCDFYESKGWMIGSSKMKNWKAAVSTWLKRSGEKNEPPKSKEELVKKAKILKLNALTEAMETRPLIDDEKKLLEKLKQELQ